MLVCSLFKLLMGRCDAQGEIRPKLFSTKLSITKFCSFWAEISSLSKDKKSGEQKKDPNPAENSTSKMGRLFSVMVCFGPSEICLTLIENHKHQ